MKNITPLKAIRLKCLDCSENAAEVKRCNIPECALYPYRMGSNPKRKGMGGNGEQLKKYRAEKGLQSK
jgi:hypothetical protein